jgi:Flp pilus assembly protein TadD
MTGFVRVTIAAALAVALSACTSDLAVQRQERIAQDPAAMMRIAAAAETSGDTAGAMAFYQRAAALQPDSTAAQMGVARSLAAQGEVDQAIEVLRSVQKRESFDAELCSTLGRLLVTANRPDEALAAFEDGLSHDPQSVPMLIGQGVSLDAAGRHDAAQESYRKVLDIDPNNRAAQKDLALSLSLSGRPASR